MKPTALKWATGLLTLVVAVLICSQPAISGLAPAGPSCASPQDAGRDPHDVTVVIKSQHKRLIFTQDVTRLAVGDTEILSAEPITNREVLALGKQTGRTTLIVWFSDGSFREHVVSVQRDLAVLERALRLVNPTLVVESAPDRDAFVLTGRVPDLATSQLAETVARNYLDAGDRRGGAEAYLAASSGGAASAREAAGSGTAFGTPGRPAAADTQAPGAGAATPPPTGQLEGAVQSSGAIINLIQLDTLPPLPEQKIREAIESLGGAEVTVRRVLRGNLRDDARDTLVLEGRVPNQVALVRVLILSAQLFAGQALTAEDIRVVADEAGALADSAQQGQSQYSQSQSLGGGASSSLFGGNRGVRLTNQVQTNLGRAKAIELAGGRVLSFIEVKDLPQVRVDIRLMEVNRSKLRALSPNAALAMSSFRQPSLNPAQSASAVQGDQAARVGSAGAAIQNVLSFLNGTLLNQVQYSGAHFAIDATLSLLEREGIARSLSSPSLTVLSGELAQVQVGGEVPVPSAFAPAFGGAVGGAAGTPGATPGVFSSVQFVPFGVQLQVRPLVGDDDTITLDVQPQIVTPDAILTDAIRQSTGATVPTTAFQTRALRTSSRLRDGEALVIGGLMSSNTSTNSAATPLLARLPILGRMFESSNRNDQATELVIVVNPVVLRVPRPDVAMWMFPDRSELLGPVLGRAAAAARR